MTIHFNTYQYVVNTFMLVFTVLICIDFANTSKKHTNTSQYMFNTLMTGRFSVVVNPPVLVCICLFFACILIVLACICLYCGWVDDHRKPPRFIACIDCISTYWYVLDMYLYEFGLYIQAVYKRIRTYRPILTQYKHRKYVCIMYVKCMYYVCIIVYWFRWCGLFLGIEYPDV